MRVLTLLLALGAAWPAAAQQAPAPDLEAGRALATQWCSNCHQVTTRGPGPASDSAPGFAAIAARPGVTLDGLSAYVRLPHANMPDHGLTARQARDVAGFLLAQGAR
jgi:mono/diheme cytochrome c family protein